MKSLTNFRFLPQIPFRFLHTKMATNSLITHNETRILPFKGIQLQSVVKDVPNYHKFVPFVQKSEVHSLLVPKLTTTNGAFVADLTIGFMAIRCNYLSNVFYEPGLVKIVKNEADPIFKELEALWKITELKDAECKIDFSIQFALINSMYNCTVQLLRNFLICKMNDAFIDRTYELYSAENKRSRERRISGSENPMCATILTGECCDPKKQEIDARVIQNLKILKESKKIIPGELDAILKMLEAKQHLCELQTIDRAYGGNISFQDLYAASLRKLVQKTRKN